MWCVWWHRDSQRFTLVYSVWPVTKTSSIIPFKNCQKKQNKKYQKEISFLIMCGFRICTPSEPNKRPVFTRFFFSFAILESWMQGKFRSTYSPPVSKGYSAPWPLPISPLLWIKALPVAWHFFAGTSTERRSCGRTTSECIGFMNVT